MKRTKMRLMSLLLVFAMLVPMIPAFATDEEISVDSFSALQQAILTAGTEPTAINVTDNFDITEAIKIQAGQDIALTGGITLTRGSDYNTGSLFSVAGALTLENIIIDGNSGNTKRDSSGTLIYIEAGGNLTANEGTRIQNNYSYRNGSGVYIDGGTFEMNGDASVRGNISYGTIYDKRQGGGIYNGAGGMIVMNENASVIGNQIGRSSSGQSYDFQGWGGGIYNVGTLIMNDNSTIAENEIRTSKSSRDCSAGGGGIYNDGIFEMHDTATISANTIYGHMSFSMGGGVYNGANGTVSLYDRASITENTASGGMSGSGASCSGGGIFNEGTVVAMGTSTLSKNKAGAGGGISNKKGSCTLTESTTISENTADTYDGGGVYTVDGTFIMEGNSSIINNSAVRGINGDGGGVRGNVTMTDNASIANNSADGEGGGVYGDVIMSKNATIKGNTAKWNSGSGGGGGGVYGRVFMSDNASIEDNHIWGSKGGGVRGTAVVSGSAKIVNNFYRNNEPNNLFKNKYNTGPVVTVVGKLAEDAVIGITTELNPAAEAPIWIVESGEGYFITDRDRIKFFSDKGYAVTQDQSNLYLEDIETITVTIKDDKGGSTTQEVPYGEKATEPELDPRPGQTLSWVTSDGEPFSFDDPITEPITVSPVWTPKEGTITGEVIDQGGQPVPFAHVAVVAGNTTYLETDTDANGIFWVHNVPYGSYNAVASKRNITATSLLELDSAVEECKVILPDTQTNSVLMVNQGTKDVVVGGLNTLFGSEIYTAEDQAVIDEGGAVTVKMTVKSVTEEEIPDTSAELKAAAQADGKTIFGYMTMDVAKITETATGDTTETNIPELPQLLQIIDPLSEEQKGKTGYVVYRMHDGHVYTITETPNENGAYIEVTDDTLTIFASKFSDYSLGFDAVTKPSTGGNSSDDDNDDDDGRRNPFIDVKPSDWFYDEVLDAYYAGYMEGITSNTFEPNAPLTRAQAAYTFAKVAQAQLKGLEITSDFEDVNGRTIYAEAITWANDAGVEIGYGNGCFGPTDSLTREQLALMLYRTYGNGQMIQDWEGDFADVADVSDWSETAVRWAVHVGLLAGNDRGELLPQGTVTRAETAALILRAVKLPQQKRR